MSDGLLAHDAEISPLRDGSEARGDVLASVRARLTPAATAGLDACVRCGLCSDACHYALTDDDPGATPAWKVGLVARAIRASSPTRTFVDWLNGARRLDDEQLAEWVDALFGRCTMCGRCTFHCVAGVNVPAIVRAARGALTADGRAPADLQAPVDLAIASGNSMGIPRDEWVETVRWLEGELQAESGDSSARLPLDEPGADFLYTVNPREAKFFPLSLLAAGAIFHAAGARWTLSSDAYDLTNYALFSGDDTAAARLADRLVATAHRLGARMLVIGECGHGFAASRWWAPTWRQRVQDLEVRSVLEVVAEYVAEGRLTLDPSRNARRMTLHDPCNLVRLGGIIEAPRRILDASAAEWVEMTPNREQNFCCGGGGGQLSMTRFARRRLAAGRIKAEQIRRTGARVVVAPCHNCIDQLTELSKEYALGVDVKTVCEVVADALVPAARPAAPSGCAPGIND